MKRAFWVVAVVLVGCGGEDRPAVWVPSDASDVSTESQGDGPVVDGNTHDQTDGPWLSDAMEAGPKPEAQADAPKDVVAPEPCSTEGGRACGGDGISGDTHALFQCKAGYWTLDHDCGGECEAMPSGVPDRCTSDLVVSKSLIDAVDSKPYVEVDCKPGSYAGWPYDAQECTYTAGGITTSVIVANPSPERVAAWIVDSSTFIPTLWNLKWVSAPDYDKGVILIGTAMMGQSSRIFPLHGGIIENMGTGYTNYPFDKGVTEGCSTGCYCRINSLHRTEWCGYQGFLGTQTYDDCIAQVGPSGLTSAWGARCLQNHIDAWNATSNSHFRAKAWKVNETVKAQCPNYKACTPAQILDAIQQALS